MLVSHRIRPAGFTRGSAACVTVVLLCALMVLPALAAPPTPRAHDPFGGPGAFPPPAAPTSSLADSPILRIAAPLALTIMAAGLLGLLVVDIRERRRTARALETTEARLRAMVESAGDALFVHRLDGSIIAVNPRACESLGYGREDLLGMSVIQIETDFASVEELRAFWATLSRDKALTVEGRHRRRDGSTFPIEARVCLMDFAGEACVLALVRDISQRVAAERAMRAAVEGTSGATGDAFFHNLAQHLAGALGCRHAIVGELTADGTRVRTLAAWMDGAFADSFEYLLADSPCGEAVRFGICHHRTGVAARFPRDAGLQRIAAESYLGICLYGSAGEPIGVLAALDDEPIDRTEAHEFLLRVFSARAAAELERKRSEAVSADLESQLRHAQKMEAVGQLAGGVAHDFNNLLQAVHGYADLALHELQEGRPEREYFEEIERAATRATALVRQLLAFSRREVLQPRLIDLNLLVADLMKMLRRLIGEHIELVARPGEDLWRVCADPGQIEQVLINLAVNSRDAMSGGGRITIETANCRLDPERLGGEGGGGDEDFVMLALADNGCGMPPEVRARVFEPFFTTKEIGRGTGLGLATVDAIVKRHSGVIEIHSRPGAGTRVAVYLPAAKEAAGAEMSAPVEVVACAGSETVLLAEDDEQVSEFTRRILERAGYTVLSAVDGTRAAELLADPPQPIDLLLLDVVMPGATGPELYDRFARNGYRETPVVFMSGYSFEVLNEELPQRPEVELLHKPFRSTELLEKVRGLLDRNAAARTLTE